MSLKLIKQLLCTVTLGLFAVTAAHAVSYEIDTSGKLTHVHGFWFGGTELIVDFKTGSYNEVFAQPIPFRYNIPIPSANSLLGEINKQIFVGDYSPDKMSNFYYTLQMWKFYGYDYNADIWVGLTSGVRDGNFYGPQYTEAMLNWGGYNFIVFRDAVAAAPESSSLVFVLIGLAGLFFRRKFVNND